MKNLADRYININCACFFPNEGRKDDIKHLFKEYKADGVILYSLSFCTPYIVESMKLEKHLKNAGIPTLTIETDYSNEDEEQIKTRVEAFLEMLNKK
ncbi:MAG: 2-hydroxyacyl-CoA dehydratase, partial [Candidatus Helarchaeota archaeon]